MRLLITAIILTTIFIGCGESGYSVFIHDDHYYKTLSSSQKAEMSYKDRTIAIFSASYLNVLYPKEYDREEESFLVGLYLTEEGDNSVRGLENPNYQIRMNLENAYEIQPVDRNSSLVVNTSFTDRWSDYYIVKFNTQKPGRLSLVLKNKKLNRSLTLGFIKPKEGK